MSDIISEFMKQLLALPATGKPAAELSEREKLALAYAVDSELVTFEVDGNMLNMRSTVDLAVSDRPGGGYIVARKLKP